MDETRGSDFLTLGAASRRLGVDPDTLRRWADAGKIDVFTTPGGHRRFPRAAVDGLLHRRRRHHASSGLGQPADRVAAELRRRVRSGLSGTSEQEWHARLDEPSIERFRARGVRMGAFLIGYLDSTGRAGRAHLVAQAEDLGREYGVEAARRGLSIGETTQALLFFRARFMAEIATVARRRSLDATGTSALFEDADRAFDGVIVALLEGHRTAAARSRR